MQFVLLFLQCFNVTCYKFSIWSPQPPSERCTARKIALICEQHSFSNLSVTSPTSQLILQHFRCFTYVTAHSHPSFVSPTSQALHLRHLVSRPCCDRSLSPVEVSDPQRVGVCWPLVFNLKSCWSLFPGACFTKRQGLKWQVKMLVSLSKMMCVSRNNEWQGTSDELKPSDSWILTVRQVFCSTYGAIRKCI